MLFIIMVNAPSVGSERVIVILLVEHSQVFGMLVHVRDFKQFVFGSKIIIWFDELKAYFGAIVRFHGVYSAAISDPSCKEHSRVWGINSKDKEFLFWADKVKEES